MNSIPTKLSSMWTQTPAGGAVLLESSPTLYKLNTTAFEIWKMIDGQRTVNEICSRMSQVYRGIPVQVLRQDVSELLDQMVEAGLISLLQAPESDSDG